ncbi:putative tetratricopeptide-like helical domain-containing protein [Rosa chinensis]|uniref:Putative tetratricopeptide-like helical domain-containing protein n=1 Tax=Rosa chinensis TaxID=74649 RepID=A0A2P6Q5A2_ROSCH|nr:uncharacterized protein LOC112166106 [Rosa chinensis]PRQ29351.1 putative tetratricopeptide-like helical domain-containing protein [Rosa chinensis]
MSLSCNSVPEAEPMEPETPDEIRRASLDFDHWTSLISQIENSHPDDVEKICSVYDSFLAEFPLCHGYWRRYAEHKMRLCSIDKVVEVFERALQAATYCVPLWVDYCVFSMSFFEDPSDIRRLFKRGMSFVRKDYGCYTLWDKYIEFEYSQQEWSSLALIYIQALRFPTKKLHIYYASLKKLATLFEEEMKSQSNSTVDLQSEALFDGEVPRFFGDDEISLVVKDLLDPAIGSGRSKALQRYICIGKQLYHEACQLDEKIGTFEINIRRSYFHVKELDAGQLENWHRYLDYVEMQGDFDWAVKLYERCLIPCANYPEFWMRYVDFVEINGGREIANYSLDRATQIFVKRVSVIHLLNAKFKEQIGDVLGARAALLQFNAESDTHFVKNVILKANMEKRLGNFTAASTIFREALAMAAEKKQSHTLPILYVHFSRLTFMMTDSANAARDVLIDGIKQLPHCKVLLEELIKFAMMNGGKQHINVIDSVVTRAISQESGVCNGLNAKDAEDISSLFLEFVDLCGTIHEVRKVWTQHVRLFPSSIRPSSLGQQSAFNVYDQQATFTKSLKLPREKEETSAAMTQQPSRDCTSDSMIELPLHDEEMLLPENHTKECGQDPAYQLSDQTLPSKQFENLQERLQLTSPEVSKEQSPANAPEANISSTVVEVNLVSQEVSDKAPENAPVAEVKQVSREVSEEATENTHVAEVKKVSWEVSEEPTENILVVEEKKVSQEVSEEPRENIPKPKMSSVELGFQVAEGNDSIESSQENTMGSNVDRECDYKSEQDPKPLSLESLSLNSEENTNLDLVSSTSPKSEASPETCTSNGKKLESDCNSDQGSYMHSPRNDRSLESAGNELVNAMPIPVFSQPPANSYGDWSQINRSDKVGKDSKLGFRMQLQKSHPQQHVPPKKYPRTEAGHPMPASQGHPSILTPSQNQQIQQGSQQAQHHNQYQVASGHANIAAPNSGPIPNVQAANDASSSQSLLPVQPVAPQMPQSSVSGNGQYAMQNPQAYNQMWQYYYYQQQQSLLQPQQHHPQQQQQLLLQQYQQQQQLQQYYVQMQQQQLLFQQQQQFQPTQQQLPLQQQQQLPLQQQQQSQVLKQLPLQEQQQFQQLQQQLQQFQQLQQQLPVQQQQQFPSQQQYNPQLQLQQQHPFYVHKHQLPLQQQSHLQEQHQINQSSIQQNYSHHQDQAQNSDIHGGTVISSLSPHSPVEPPQK